MSITPYTGGGDDTGSNSVEMMCGDGSNGALPLLFYRNKLELEKTAYEGYYGEWSEWVSCPEGMAIDGMNLQIEAAGSSPEDDDTAMNGVKFSCSPVSGTKHSYRFFYLKQYTIVVSMSWFAS